MRARSAGVTGGPAGADLLFQQMPDATVITDSSGRVRSANQAFVQLCQAPDEHKLRGWPIADALGDTQGHWAELLQRVRATGLVGRARLWIHGAGASRVHVEVSAALLAEGDQEDIGFTLRILTEPDSEPATAPAQALSGDFEALVAQLGRQSLAQLLLQARTLAERHLIEAALKRSGGGMDRAAEMLEIPVASLAARIHALGLSPPRLLN